MAGNSLINLGDLSKPATVLIEKISDAVGGIFKPHQIVRVAKAEAEADRIQAESQIQVTDLQRRAMHRFLEEEAKKQSNIEAITRDALPLLRDDSQPQNVEDDWITNFFDKSRIVSDHDMQQLWSRVLAAEANAPGAFAKRTVTVLADMDKSDAELFSHLCGFCWVFGDPQPLIFSLDNRLYMRFGLNFEALSHLESVGLLQFNTFGEFQLETLPKHVTMSYFGHETTLTFPAETNNSLPIGKVLLTRAGDQLFRVCGAVPVDEFYDFVYNRWVIAGLIA